MRWTDEKVTKLRELATAGKSAREIGEHFSVSEASVWMKCSKLKIKTHGTPGRPASKEAPLAGEGTSVTVTGDASVVTLRSSTARTLDDAIREAQIDLSVWQVDRYIANKWDQGSKADGGVVQVIELWQIKVWLKRIAPGPVVAAFERLCERLPAAKPRKVSIKKIEDPHLLEMSLYDAHFGKLCWGLETGSKYDLKIARRVYADAVEDLMSRANGYPVERILYPLGQDFFQVDNWVGTTAKGTVVDTDGRFQKTFEVGVDAVVEAIKLCLQIAPVKVIWIPGNHDVTTSWYLAKLIQAYFRMDERVTVNASPMKRKYHHYGVSLIGFTHGDIEPHRDLPTIMASEQPEEWAATTCREWHVGHFHKRKETRYSAGDAFGAVGVRVLPSLSGTDSWHYDHGFVKTVRAAEAYLWSKTDGYVGHFAVSVRKGG